MTLKDVSSGYHSLKLDKKPSYLTTFICQFDRYRFTRLLFGVALVGDMFQQKHDEIFKVLPNIFGTADILIVGYDSDDRNHNMTLRKVMQICLQENLKVDKNKCHFRSTIIPFWGGEVISSNVVHPDPKHYMHLSKCHLLLTKKKELQSSLGTMTYLAKS